MKDFGFTKYCKKCGLETWEKGEIKTFTVGDKFCECKKKEKKE